MKMTFEMVEILNTENAEDLRVCCECDESYNGKITLTIPKYNDIPAKHITLTDNEFDAVTAVVEDFRKKRSALVSTHTKGNPHG